MKLYNSAGPNPRAVRFFAAECGANLDLEEVDLMGAENRGEKFLKVNPAGQLPALVLDDGTVITEITAICEYLGEICGPTSLIGTTAEQRAETRMWTRRIDLAICENLANGFRYGEGKPLFENRITVIPHASADLKALAQEKISWLDGLLAGKAFICGERFSLADILLFSFLDFGASVGQPLNEDNKNIMVWFGRVKHRPGAEA